MGVLKVGGNPLSWEQTKVYREKIKLFGLIQFVKNYNRMKNKEDFAFKWGDEVEHYIVNVDETNKTTSLCLNGDKVLSKLHALNSGLPENQQIEWKPEYSNFMVESSPGAPYSDSLDQLALVEDNMLTRRNQALKVLNEQEKIITMTHFPLIGCKRFTKPAYDVRPENNDKMTKSIFFPSQAMSRHPRHKAFTKALYKRKGKKLTGNIPIYSDTNTSSPFKENFTDEEDSCSCLENHIYMDSTQLAFSSCSVQVTVQAANLKQATFLHDQLAVVSPIMLAMSAASPFYRGHVSNVDTRWALFTQCCDDRSDEELPEIKHSRFSSVQLYLSQENSELNDVEVAVNGEAYDYLISQGVRKEIAKHVAHLWVRDPLILFPDETDFEADENYRCFENIQSTVWQDLRFKPPPDPHSDIGWRVEFRPVEAQPSEFENSAFICFVVVLARAIVHFEVDLTIPMSMVHGNMERAQGNDACRKNLFSFRDNIGACDEDEKISLMSIDAIVNGDNNFVGLMGLVSKFLKTQKMSQVTQKKVQGYMNHISSIASAKVPTTAQRMRNFVKSHEDYKKDSKISGKINFDMVKSIWKA